MKNPFPLYLIIVFLLCLSNDNFAQNYIGELAWEKNISFSLDYNYSFTRQYRDLKEMATGKDKSLVDKIFNKQVGINYQTFIEYNWIINGGVLKENINVNVKAYIRDKVNNSFLIDLYFLPENYNLKEQYEKIINLQKNEPYPVSPLSVVSSDNSFLMFEAKNNEIQVDETNIEWAYNNPVVGWQTIDNSENNSLDYIVWKYVKNKAPIDKLSEWGKYFQNLSNSFYAEKKGIPKEGNQLLFIPLGINPSDVLKGKALSYLNTYKKIESSTAYKISIPVKMNSSESQRIFVHLKTGISCNGFRFNHVSDTKGYFEKIASAVKEFTIDFTLESNENKIVNSRGTFIDERDGHKYKWVQIGEQVWMAENLAFKGVKSKVYDNNDLNEFTYGRLYDWETACWVCPSGWHLPSDGEWTELANFLSREHQAAMPYNQIWKNNIGEVLKTTFYEASNIIYTDFGNGGYSYTLNMYGFDAKAGGMYEDGFVGDPEFNGLGKEGCWYSSTKPPNHGRATVAEAKFYILDFTSNEFRTHVYYEQSFLSVRCIKDK